MSLNNFYADSDKVSGRWAAPVAGAIFVLAFLFTAPCWFYLHQSEFEERQKRARIKRVDALCSDLPKPENFRFIMRDITTPSRDSTTVSYYYHSDRDFDEVMPTFQIWFNENGWQRAESDGLGFKKDNQRITIDNHHSADVDKPVSPDRGIVRINYQIYCSETGISSEID